jgi:hypothetical protein
MNTANRILWAVLGLILLALGVFGVLASLDQLRGIDGDSAVLPNSLNERWNEWGFWAPALTVVVGIVLALLGLALLRAQTRRRGGAATGELVVAHVDSGPDGRAPSASGTTRVEGRTLVHALTADLARDRHIESASANLIGTAVRPRLVLHLDVVPGADLSQLHGVVDAALERFNRTSGLRPQVTDVDVRLTNERIARVH